MYFRTGVVEESDAAWVVGLRTGEAPFDRGFAAEVFLLAGASLGGVVVPLISTGVSLRRWGGVGVSGVRGGLCSDTGICFPFVHG